MDGDEQKFSENTKFDTVCPTAIEHIYRSQRRKHHANPAGLEHISMVKNHVAE